MLHQGDILKELIKREGYTQQGFADKLGISRIYLLDLLKKKIVNKIYLQDACKILKINIEIFEKPESNTKQNQTTTTDMDFARITIAAMQKTIDTQLELIDSLKRKIAELEEKPLSKQGYK